MFNFINFHKICLDFQNNVIYGPTFCKHINYNVLCVVSSPYETINIKSDKPNRSNVTDVTDLSLYDNANAKYFIKNNLNSVSFNVLWIKIKLRNNYITAFIDTGAPYSSIRKKTIDTCNLKDIVDYDYFYTSQSFSDKQVINNGIIYSTEFFISNFSFHNSFKIDDSTFSDILLGLDFLVKNNVIIDTNEKKIIFDNVFSIDFQ